MAQVLYIHPDNPQKRLIDQVIHFLNQGGVIVYPTDSGYNIGCTLDNKNGLERIIRLRDLDKNHHFTLMCRDLSELSQLARVSNPVYRLIKNNTPGSYTFILEATKEVPRRLMNEKRKTVGLRIPTNTIALSLLEALNAPMMSTTLILPGNEFAESDPEQIDDMIGNQVDAIIHGGYLGQKPTTVVDLTDDEPVILREGNGDCTPFR